MMVKIFCRILGVLYVIAGGAGLVAGEEADRYHNVLHLVTGVLALYFGFARPRSRAKVFCLAAGGAYLVFGGLGIVAGNPAMNRLWNVGLITVSLPDHIHHIVLGSILVVVGIFTRRGEKPRELERVTDNGKDRLRRPQ